MASAEAQKAKDRGNAAFKSGSYAEAVGHYTSAILADRSDPTFPLNRAAAYLKLGKNEDAERDCSTVLILSPGHVKALFRRAQARIELAHLDEAEHDLSEALKREPQNSSILVEQQRIVQLKSKTKGNRKQNTSDNVSRRRVPIEIIHSKKEKVAITGASDQSEVKSSGSVKADTTLASTSTDSKITDKVKVNLPEAEETTRQKPAPKVGGGIFRASGKHTIVRSPSESVTETAKHASPPVAPITDAPTSTRQNDNIKPLTSIFSFSRTWETLQTPLEKWKLFSQIGASSLPTFFQASLETSLLTSIVDMFADVLVQDTTGDLRAKVRAYMIWLPKVPRFQMVTLFMSDKEKEVARAVCSAVGVEWDL